MVKHHSGRCKVEIRLRQVLRAFNIRAIEYNFVLTLDLVEHGLARIDSPEFTAAQRILESEQHLAGACTHIKDHAGPNGGRNLCYARQKRIVVDPLEPVILSRPLRPVGMDLRHLFDKGDVGQHVLVKLVRGYLGPAALYEDGGQIYSV